MCRHSWRIGSSCGIGFDGFVELPEIVVGHQDMLMNAEVVLTFGTRTACFLQRLK